LQTSLRRLGGPTTFTSIADPAFLDLRQGIRTHFPPGPVRERWLHLAEKLTLEAPAPVQSPAMAARVIVVLGLALLTSCAKARSPAPPPAPAASATPAVTQAPVSTRASYELQEKCARDARDWYKHAWEDVPKAPDMEVFSNYTNHYSARRGQCFIVVSSTTVTHSKKTGKPTSTDMGTLTDVLENRDLAAFDSVSSDEGTRVTQCKVAEILCGSRDEWNSLTKRYTEE